MKIFVTFVTSDLLYPIHMFSASIVSQPNMFIPAKIADYAAKTLCVFLTISEYQYYSNGNFNAIPLFMWYISFAPIAGKWFLIWSEMFDFPMSVC